MKPQDILFVVVVIGLLITCRKKPQAFIMAGLFCLLTAIPLFAFWVFFTAQRLAYYAGGFFLIGIIIMYIKAIKAK